MTAEQIAAEILDPDLERTLSPADAESLRQRIADALRAAAVNEEMRERAASLIADLLLKLRHHADHPLVSVSWEGQSDDIPMDVRRLAEEFASQISAGADIALPADPSWQFEAVAPGPEMQQMLERLAFLLGLSPLERGFLRHYEVTRDKNTWLVFADWLDEQNRPELATRMRTMFPQPGQVAVLTLPTPTHPEGSRIARETGQIFAEEFGVQVILLFGEQTLEMMNAEQMRQNGWMKTSEHNEILARILHILAVAEKSSAEHGIFRKVVEGLLLRLKQEVAGHYRSDPNTPASPPERER